MKKIIASLLILLAACFACTNSGKNSLTINPDEMPAGEYTIDTERDTILVTQNGALLKIPRGAIDAGSKKQVTLEIKEAYTISQMIKNGLTTSSGEEPMSSGGMICISPKKGQSATIKKKIDVALPTRYKDQEMKLFKGEESNDGRINWVTPDTLPVTAFDKSLTTGKALFNAVCSSCHKIGQRATGPDLAHYLRQYSGDTLLVRGYQVHWPSLFWSDGSVTDTTPQSSLQSRLRHISSELWDNQFIYFCNQKAAYGSLGTNFPDLTERDYDAIYNYIQNESDRLQLPDPQLRQLSDCLDSCTLYKERLHDLTYRQQQINKTRDRQITGNGNQTKESANPVPAITTNTGNNRNTPARPVFSEKEIVNPANQSAVYYQFSIETFGWYNIDVLLKDMPGNQKSQLSVRVTGAFQTKLDVFLIIPEKKIYTKGGLKNDGSGKYVFAYTDGTIYLPLEASAYILGLTENADGVAYGIIKFTIRSSQELELSLNPTSPDAFNKAVNELEMKDIKISSKQTKYADSIRMADTLLKNLESEREKLDALKPKNCDCDCGKEGFPVTEISTEK